MSTRFILAEPFAVVADFQMLGIGEENLADLGDVGFGVGVDLFAGEHAGGFDFGRKDRRRGRCNRR